MRKFISDVKLGSDPELFIIDKKTKLLKSSVGLIGGSKEDPKPLFEPGFFAQEDNVLVEFNIPPAVTTQAFVENITSGVSQIEKLLGLEYELRAMASAFMPIEELQTFAANSFGCSPDNNAWDEGHYNPPPITPSSGLRSAGAHIHIGYTADVSKFKKEGIDKKNFDIELIKLCDLYLGIPSVLMDSDTERKKLYGKAGSYRHKPYGVEYRVLSSFWLNSKNKIAWAFDQTMRAVEVADELKFMPKRLGKKVEKIINTSDAKAAEALVKEFDLKLA